MESSWNRKPKFLRYDTLIVEEVKQETPDFKIIIASDGKERKERKAVRSDFSSKDWKQIRKGAKIMLPIGEDIVGKPFVAALEFPKDFDWGNLSAGDYVFWCLVCGDVFPVNVIDDPWGQLLKITEVHTEHAGNCDGILCGKFRIYNHRQEPQEPARLLLTTIANQEKE